MQGKQQAVPLNTEMLARMIQKNPNNPSLYLATSFHTSSGMPSTERIRAFFENLQEKFPHLCSYLVDTENGLMRQQMSEEEKRNMKDFLSVEDAGYDVLQARLSEPINPFDKTELGIRIVIIRHPDKSCTIIFKGDHTKIDGVSSAFVLKLLSLADYAMKRFYIANWIINSFLPENSLYNLISNTIIGGILWWNNHPEWLKPEQYASEQREEFERQKSLFKAGRPTDDFEYYLNKTKQATPTQPSSFSEYMLRDNVDEADVSVYTQELDSDKSKQLLRMTTPDGKRIAFAKLFLLCILISLHLDSKKHRSCIPIRLPIANRKIGDWTLDYKAINSSLIYPIDDSTTPADIAAAISRHNKVVKHFKLPAAHVLKEIGKQEYIPGVGFNYIPLRVTPELDGCTSSSTSNNVQSEQINKTWQGELFRQYLSYSVCHSEEKDNPTISVQVLSSRQKFDPMKAQNMCNHVMDVMGRVLAHWDHPIRTMSNISSYVSPRQPSANATLFHNGTDMVGDGNTTSHNIGGGCMPLSP